MNKETLEHISSLMDGELSRETGLFLTRRLSGDAALGQAWRRYHLIRDCLRQPGGRVSAVDFAQEVRIALAGEAPATASSRNRWLKPASGLAIAATVAFMAIVVVGPEPQPATEPLQESAAAPSFSSPNVVSAGPATQAASYNPVDAARAARLNSYLLRHNQMAGTAGRQGFVSFVPIISANAQPEPESEMTDEPAATSQEQTSTTP
jgi:sigma-E factor negative regulatory protein RseA